jgi:pimeloyl-ACP methyl ester carboxylesterase
MPRKALRITAVVGAVVTAILLVFLGVLAYWSPGKPRDVTDENGRPLAGSISEKVRVRLNGVEQGMFIRGKDRTKPVLLFLHGGPGMPEYFLERTHPTGLEEDFVVCWWEQRGAGLSYSSDVAPETMTVNQLLADALAVTDYLRYRFGQDKIYLLAHSWGSFLGIQLAQQAPDRYHAYIGMGQVSHQMESEVLTYQYQLERYREIGDEGMVRKLEEAPVTMTAPMPEAYIKLRDTAMHKLGIGTTRDMDSVVTGVFLPVWRTPDYTIMEKVNIGRGKAFSQDALWDTFLNTDLTTTVTKLEIPVYFWHGAYDYTVSHDLAKAYWERLEAPVKGFYTFDQSAHSPAFEEPAKMRQILREDVLKGRTTLADSTG